MGDTNFPAISMIGFGEAGRAFASGWCGPPQRRIAAHDLRVGDGSGEIEAAAADRGVRCAPTSAAAMAGADVVFCLVTADQAVAAARQAAPTIPAGALWCDGNSCAPGSKRRAAAVIEEAGGRYVDMAIMAPVAARRHRTPVLLSGPHAHAARDLFGALDMDATIAGQQVGDASAIKMMRSVMIKGLEALSAECFLGARRAGVDAEVLASLAASDPEWNWAARGAYNLERMLVHGMRRAAEMREVAATLRELGLPDRMSAAAAEWQADLGGLAITAGPDALDARSDRVLAAIRARDEYGRTR